VGFQQTRKLRFDILYQRLKKFWFFFLWRQSEKSLRIIMLHMTPWALFANLVCRGDVTLLPDLCSQRGVSSIHHHPAPPQSSLFASPRLDTVAPLWFDVSLCYLALSIWRVTDAQGRRHLRLSATVTNFPVHLTTNLVPCRRSMNAEQCLPSSVRATTSLVTFPTWTETFLHHSSFVCHWVDFGHCIVSCNTS